MTTSLLEVRVQPRARREGVQGWRSGALRLSVLAAPEDGKANRRRHRPSGAGVELPPE